MSNLFAGASDSQTIMGVTIDSINGYLYSGVIHHGAFRARLDGTSKEMLFLKGKICVVYLTKALLDATLTCIVY